MHHMIPFSFKLEAISNKVAVDEVLRTNKISQQYGLILTSKDAEELVENTREILRAIGRVEIGNTTISKIISKFYNSSYLWQGNYVETLHELIEIFYYMKNETLDMIGDDELIEYMKIYFENTCRGSIELLQGRELEIFARNIRYGISHYDKLENDSDDEFDVGEDY